MDNLEEMGRLGKFNPPILNQEEIEIMNNPIRSTKIDAVINNLPKIKSPGPDGFREEFCQTFREELMPILLKIFHKTAGEGTFPNSFYKAWYHPDTKTRQRQHQEKKTIGQYHW